MQKEQKSTYQRQKLGSIIKSLICAPASIVGQHEVFPRRGRREKYQVPGPVVKHYLLSLPKSDAPAQKADIPHHRVIEAVSSVLNQAWLSAYDCVCEWQEWKHFLGKCESRFAITLFLLLYGVFYIIIRELVRKTACVVPDEKINNIWWYKVRWLTQRTFHLGKKPRT